MESLIEAMSGDTISQILFRNNQGRYGKELEKGHEAGYSVIH